MKYLELSVFLILTHPEKIELEHKKLNFLCTKFQMKPFLL